MDWIDIFKTFTPGAAGIWTGVIMFAGWILREWRETRKLSAEDRLARREGYAKQVENLQNECRALLGDLKSLRQEYDHYRQLCHDETDALRKLVMRLEGEIAGYKRRLDLQAMELLHLKGTVEEGLKDG